MKDFHLFKELNHELALLYSVIKISILLVHRPPQPEHQS